MQALADALYELCPTGCNVGLTTLRSHKMVANANDGHDFWWQRKSLRMKNLLRLEKNVEVRVSRIYLKVNGKLKSRHSVYLLD